MEKDRNKTTFLQSLFNLATEPDSATFIQLCGSPRYKYLHYTLLCTRTIVVQQVFTNTMYEIKK